ncbi:phosphotransferase family protein [Streptomyces sp. N35]|uniref:phosphotransferase family protein n=1 Tax=Streptomyces sp. N35 TaxID=2795730 RepID=UPI0018F2F296|nr:aminoglycoside phosphotransferase family protein [Streptomyces sp. N35]
MTVTHPGGYPPAELCTLLDRCCATAGLDARGAVLLRGQTNAVFRLASAPVLVKIASSGTPVERVRHTVDFTTWLMNQGFPTAPLHAGPEQPVVLDGRAATLWTYLPQPAGPVGAQELALPLRRLHQLQPLAPELAALDGITAIRRSLSRTRLLPSAVVAELHAQASRIEAELADLSYELPRAAVHGDPQHANALYTPTGVVLCDWDSAAIGPPEWDLVTVEVHCRRFGYAPAHYRSFAEAYGWDVRDWDGYPVLRDLRELRMITTNARKASHAPSTLSEVRRRIEGLRQGDLHGRWSIL